MKEKDFTISHLVDKSPNEVFDIIMDVRGWWNGEIEGDTKTLNEEFSYRFKDIHYSKQKLVEIVPGQKIVWLITDSFLNFVEDKNEWTGHHVIFDITPKDGKTEVRLTHKGLVPSVECYNACSGGWISNFGRGWLNYITTGNRLNV
ncbi:SRPBCC domain-containing protein [Chitinophaga silvatica]|uniref:SRPBCC domain-containing protein n=1 Tax=Chitinophaga silvatica TaxID=2282649 RepID=A0A3E1Y8Q3_9BACT|nr:SRPBCC domain-containing protein [Chitinophaga silvatica]RFS21787.1 SRPBCC domain-containing protein [Chitinophaga silvatica]